MQDAESVQPLFVHGKIDQGIHLQAGRQRIPEDIGRGRRQPLFLGEGQQRDLLPGGPFGSGGGRVADQGPRQAHDPLANGQLGNLPGGNFRFACRIAI